MKNIKDWTIEEVKEYEMKEYVKAQNSVASNPAYPWKVYRKNVKRVVTIWNKAHAEQIDIDAIME